MACYTVTHVENNRVFVLNIAKLLLVNMALKKSLYLSVHDFNHLCSREP